MTNLDINVLIENVAVNLLKLAEVKLPHDVKQAIKEAYVKERNPVGKTQLGAILENLRLAEEKDIPICQDTGLISFYLRAGSGFKALGGVEKALSRAVRRATTEIPLRPNAVEPFMQKNTNDNVGRHVPYIHWQIINENFLEITAFPKGGGSENASTLKMLKPSEGLDGVRKFVLESVIEAGGLPCPPTIIGIGIGGGANIAMELAKMALLKPLNEPNPNEGIAKMERELLEAINKTGIGPMGLGGDSTALAVKIEYAHRHPASYPVAVAFQCWAARKATARIFSDGLVEYLTHKIC
ncbi:MAG: fumarate hydratase [Candidatus Bathyarchaeia archaeon]